MTEDLYLCIMDKLEHLKYMGNNISIQRNFNATIPDVDYICPLCLKQVSIEQARETLTAEHVPQDSLGGIPITLTCRDCNTNCGSDIDVYLRNLIMAIERRQFLPGTDRKVFVHHDGNRLGALLKVGNNRDLSLNIDTRHNNPKIWNDFYKKRSY